MTKIQVDDVKYDCFYEGEVPVAQEVGLPFVQEYRLPMLNLEKAWYEATRVYGPYNYHPERCEDWNLETMGNTDLGEPLVAPFTGLVIAAADYGGGVGRVVQLLGINKYNELVVWAGWHLHKLATSRGQIVQVGKPIGSIGNADGRYAGAHLHEQICVVNQNGIPHPTTFASDNRYNWQQPSAFYLKNGVDPALIARVTKRDNQ